jgi:hypothetical protein
MGNQFDMLTHNARFIRAIITNTLFFGCLAGGVSWLEPLALPWFLASHWPEAHVITPEAALKGAFMTHRRALAAVVVCVLLAVLAFVDGCHHGTLFVRQPVSQLRLISYVLAWCGMIICDASFWWHHARPKNFTGLAEKS